MIHITKSEISRTAKSIRAELKSKNKNINQTKMLEILSKSMGFENYNDYLLKLNSNYLTTYDQLSLVAFNQYKQQIIKNLKSNFGLIVENILFLDIKTKPQITAFKKNVYNYTICQYMQIYNTLNNRVPSDHSDYIVETFDDLMLMSEYFVYDLLLRYKDVKQQQLSTDSIKDIKIDEHFTELLFLQKRLLLKEEFTKCEIIIDKIINSNITDPLFLINLVKNEIIQNKIKEENLVQNNLTLDKPTPFYFKDINKDEVLKINEINKSMKNGEYFLGNNKAIINNKSQYLSEDDILKGVFLLGCCGSGKTTFLLSLALQSNIKKRGFIFFDMANDLGTYSALNLLVSMNNQYSKLIILKHENFIKLSKEEIKSFVNNNRMVYVIPGFDDNQNVLTHREKFSTKIKKLLTDISLMDTKKPYYIYVNEADDIKGFSELHTDILSNSNKNNLAIIPTYQDLQNVNSQSINQIKYKIIMKSEADSSLFMSNERIQSAIKNLKTGEFILLENNNSSFDLDVFHVNTIDSPNNNGLQLAIDKN